ncbi:hypothetical protein AK812_SmicGene25750 [Symbiodinium microadriaticum]|uniref:Uncharacterized protein n=1 Tax=Symbiodinium microadriaticum TaxID=2951 RepID=A0A1Q9DBC3_SYMMI|nr:hypothetical protein AK812_SmicGene25750 [Symbiodinium microadriaticum]CAE7335171.1 unnamed protein product [Symbiodinium microadriaticum]
MFAVGSRKVLGRKKKHRSSLEKIQADRALHTLRTKPPMKMISRTERREPQAKRSIKVAEFDFHQTTQTFTEKMLAGINLSGRCFSKFKSCGKFHRTAPPRESPLEVPRDDIAHVMEAATAAASSNANQAEKPDDDARTMAEPEMEIDNDDMVDENELDEEQQDPDANESQDEVAERRPQLPTGTTSTSTVGVIMMLDEKTTTSTIELLINSNIIISAKYTAKLTRRSILQLRGYLSMLRMLAILLKILSGPDHEYLVHEFEQMMNSCLKENHYNRWDRSASFSGSLWSSRVDLVQLTFA